VLVGEINEKGVPMKNHMDKVRRDHSLHDLINKMFTERRLWAHSRGFTVTDDEIADHIALRLTEMMKVAS
jgi:hypothetical protein